MHRRLARPAANGSRLRLECLESRTLLSAGPALDALAQDLWNAQRDQADQYNLDFYIYQNRDAGGNHFTPSWVINSLTLEIDSGVVRGPGDTCIQVTWDGQPGRDGTQWAGLGFEEPQGHFSQTAPPPPDNPYALFGGIAPAGARLVFDARIESKDAGDDVEIGFGENGDSCGVFREWITPQTAWTTYSVDVSGRDFSHVHCGFIALFQDIHDLHGDGVRVAFDTVHFTWARPDQPRLVQSYDVRPDLGTEFDKTHANTAYTYDQALEVLVSDGSGGSAGTALSGQIGQGLMDALDHDWAQSPPDGTNHAGKRLYNAYMSGDPLDNQLHAARPTGWWEVSAQQWQIHNYALDGGVNAWAMLACLERFDRTGDSAYLTAARDIGNWVVSELKDPAGGFFVGWQPDGHGGWGNLIHAKSTEHSVDLYCSFRRLSDIYAAQGNTTESNYWLAQARHAGDWVMSMYQQDEGRFCLGTNEDGTRNEDHYVLDVQTWTYLALAHSPDYATAIPDWTLQIRWAEQNLKYTRPDGISGFDYGYLRNDPNDHAPDGIWWEGTAQMADVYLQLGELDNYLATMASIEAYYRKEGTALMPATDRTDGEGGLSTGFDWRYYHRESISGSAWASMAIAGTNPFWSCRTVGQIDFLELTGQNPASSVARYLLRTTRPGTLTIEASAASGSVAATLYDAQFHRVAGPAIRTDWPVSAAGESYYVELAGTAADATLRLVNLVERSGAAVAVYGTSGPDDFDFDAGTQSLTVKGVPYDFSGQAVTSYSFDGVGGDDRVVLKGRPDQIDAVELWKDQATMSAPDYAVTVNHAAHFTTVGDIADVAVLHGTGGNNAFIGSPTQSSMSGGGVDFTVQGFGSVAAYGEGFTGLAETAYLTGSTGDDTMTATPSEVKLTAGGVVLDVQGFRRVLASSSGNSAIAAFSGEAGKIDLFSGGPGKSYMYRGDVYYNEAKGFATVQATADTNDTSDVATLYDSAGADAFDAVDSVGTLSNTALGFTIQTTGYCKVFVNSTDDGSVVDRATFQLSPAAATAGAIGNFRAWPDHADFTMATVSGKIYTYSTTYFESVDATSQWNGGYGSGVARFFDGNQAGTYEDDHFYSEIRPNAAYNAKMTGQRPNGIGQPKKEYWVYAHGYPVALATATHGADTADMQGLDAAAGINAFRSYGPTPDPATSLQAKLSPAKWILGKYTVSNFGSYVGGFASLVAHGNGGADDTAVLYDSNTPTGETFISDPGRTFPAPESVKGYACMFASTFSEEVHGFTSVNAVSAYGNDTAKFYGIAGVADTFQGYGGGRSAAKASVMYGGPSSNLAYYVTATHFQNVEAHGNTGEASDQAVLDDTGKVNDIAVNDLLSDGPNSISQTAVPGQNVDYSLLAQTFQTVIAKRTYPSDGDQKNLSGAFVAAGHHLVLQGW